jgi:D-apionolactonase
MADNKIYYGSPTKPPESIPLNAGPLSLIYQDGYLRSIEYRGIEILKRIYFALRDPFWNTIPGLIESLVLNSSDDHFSITFTSKHVSGDIHINCASQINGTNEGRIEFSINAVAQSSFQRNRIGFCVLHPIDLCAGAPCKVRSIDGSMCEGTFPSFIEPWQPFKCIRSVEYDIDTGSSVEITFEGDTFEMEDQRNWTDNSFKTYSTPLSEPMPVTVETGTVIKQKIILCIKDTGTSEEIKKTERISIQIPDISSLSKSVPQIGTIINTPLSPAVIEKAELLSFSHLRFDLFLESESIVDEIETISGICRQLRIPAELALHFGSEVEDELLFTYQLLATSQIPVARFLIFKENESVTSTNTILLVVPVLKKYAPDALIAAGTNNYFADLNRNHPPAQLLDQICYSATPQVHTVDNVAVMENLPGIAETLQSATLFFGKAQPVISPITLRPRKNSKKPQKSGGDDDRQKGLFCSAWTVANLMYCIEGGASSITYFALSGDSGVIDEDGLRVYPVYHILSSAAEMTGTIAGTCACNDISRIATMVFVNGIQLLLQIANLTDKPQKVNINNLPSTIFCKFIDETTFYEVTNFPEQWQITKGIQMDIDNQMHEFELLPYAVLQIESAIVK